MKGKRKLTLLHFVHNVASIEGHSGAQLSQGKTAHSLNQIKIEEVY